MKKLIAVLIAAVAIGLGLFYSGAWLGEEEETFRTVDTAVARVGELRLAVAATGVVTPDAVVMVKSKAGGEIIDLPFNEGDRVAKGDIVVRLDPSTEKTRVNQAEANLLMAEAKLDKTRVARKDSRLKLKRQSRLYSDGIISTQELDDAKIAYEMSLSDVKIAEAEVIQSKEQLKEAREFLDDTIIRAPLTGTVLKKFVDEGQIISSTLSSVSEGTVLFSMANLDRLYVNALVDEVDIGGVRAGQIATAAADSLPATIFDARVKRVSPQGRVERTVTVFEVLIEITDNDKTGLRPGMTADIEIVTGLKKGVLLVPNSAIKLKKETTGVYVLKETRPAWTPVVTADTNGIETIVVEGLMEGAVVVTAGVAEKSVKKGDNRRGILRMFRRRKR